MYEIPILAIGIVTVILGGINSYFAWHSRSSHDELHDKLSDIIRLIQPRQSAPGNAFGNFSSSSLANALKTRVFPSIQELQTHISDHDNHHKRISVPGTNAITFQLPYKNSIIGSH